MQGARGSAAACDRGGAGQSVGLLARARARDMAVWLEHQALGDLWYACGFDAVITTGAMGNVPPGDWPLALANLHRPSTRTA